ncbi:MAG TPA: IPT/TIG domain-containing protein, partial [Syntrophomonadaceae bacterium]|nr:IPT/TIG domain-containing protein [Syntrophomonadaceae bacterium]
MRRKRIKWISLILTFIFMFTLIPINAVHAEDIEVKLTSIDVIKTYNGINNVTGYVLSIRGEGLLQTKVWRQKSNGQSIELRPSRSSNAVLEFSIPHNTSEEGNIILKEIEIETQYTSRIINIAEDTMPRINTLNPTKLKPGGTSLEITGENFGNIGTDSNKVKAMYLAESTEVDITGFADANGITIPPASIAGVLGSQNIYFTRDLALPNSVKLDSSHPDINLKVQYRHLGIFRIYNDLAISGEIEMYPNRGPQETKVYFQADELPSDISVFFLKAGDSSDAFKQSNKGRFINYYDNISPEKDRLVVEVPTLSIGEYEVYLTNKVEDGDLPEHKVTRERKLDHIFTVIDSSSQGQILSLNPNRGPDGGIDNVIIQGKNLASISPNIFEPAPNSEPIININGEKLVVEYENGKYKEFNKDENVKLSRTIKLIVGNYVTFNPEVNQIISPEGLDNISVNIPQFEMVDKDTLVDVKAIIQTTITYGERKINYHEEVVKLGGFTFYPSSLEPIIEIVIPDKIMIDSSNQVTDDRMIAIYGKNFLIHKYEENGKDAIRYPIIKLGNIVIDKNKDNDLQVLVLDNANNVLDGSLGKEVGTKLLITIPAGSIASKPGTANVEITNPMRFSDKSGRTAIAYDKIEFVINVEKPYITRVNPDVVTVGGGEEVTIEGSNFRPGVQVFVDGNEVKGIVREGTGSKITFKAPPGRAGTTQLQVMNTDGGIAVWPFMYVTTYTDPKITDFNPKKGSYNTLVVVKGQNFLKPDPTGTDNEILKLIGLRVFLENEDINSYNRDEYNRIALQPYESATGNLVINPDNGELASYFHSVVFEKETGSYYVLRQEPDGTIQLTNGRDETYIIEKAGEGLQARNQSGKSFALAVNK